jgi:hypothetical protein
MSDLFVWGPIDFEFFDLKMRKMANYRLYTKSEF